MAGMKVATGLNGSVVGGLYGGYGGAAVPAASGIPEGPTTITQQAFGVPSATRSGRRIGLSASAISTGALVLLAFIWWALPRLGGGNPLRFSLFSFVLGLGAYWAVQHFTGFGNTGRASAG